MDAHQDVVTNPAVLFEVLSDSTEKFDRVTKFREYQKLQSLRHYVLISQNQILVEHFEKQPDGKWSIEFLESGGVLRLSCCAVKVPVDALYRRVTFSAKNP